ncbi:MAG: LysR family transcriptional regulator [Oscillospiraceae bacterium]|nr:LysR family transcriptional regulator [Oscillospiraceae bacterium]
MEKKLHASISVRMFTDQKCFGPGIAQLLRAVDELHSLRAAAMSMQMAYSKAWTIMKNAEEGLGVKLLKSSVGGKNGGGAALTEEGVQILDAYEEYCRRLNVCAAKEFDELFAFYEGLKKEGANDL